MGLWSMDAPLSVPADVASVRATSERLAHHLSRPMGAIEDPRATKRKSKKPIAALVVVDPPVQPPAAPPRSLESFMSALRPN